MQQIVQDYVPLADLERLDTRPMGDSASPKSLIFHILSDPSGPVEVLDIGFGAGNLGKLIKQTEATRHWHVDGVDGWQANCHNAGLIGQRTYRNIWHGLAQDLPSDRLARYDIICLLDVIEHLTAPTAKWLMRTLLTSMGDHAFLFVSTPLWFYPQDGQQEGDLELHRIGIPASSMLAMVPRMYAINAPLIGGFVYGKGSLKYSDFFEPSSDPDFSYEMGMTILRALNVEAVAGVVYKPGVSP